MTGSLLFLLIPLWAHFYPLPGIDCQFFTVGWFCLKCTRNSLYITLGYRFSSQDSVSHIQLGNGRELVVLGGGDLTWFTDITYRLVLVWEWNINSVCQRRKSSGYAQRNCCFKHYQLIWVVNNHSVGTFIVAVSERLIHCYLALNLNWFLPPL